jgi:hypothetical protein
MRTWIVVEATATNRARLEAVVADRNSPQKRSPHYGEHMWRWAHVVNDPTFRRSKTRRGFEE